MYGTNNVFSKKMKFYDVRLKNYLVLCARRGRGLNHSGGNYESSPGGGGGYTVFQVMGMIEWDRRALLTTDTCQIFLPKKLPQTKISNPQRFFDHPRHLKFGVPPWGSK